MTADELKEMFGDATDKELGARFGRKEGAVSAWRKNGVPASIEMKAREMLEVGGNKGNGRIARKRRDRIDLGYKAGLPQLVEDSTRNRDAASSILASGSTK